MTKYETVSIPKDVLDYIDQLRNHPEVWRKYFFSSRAEFIRTAITRFIDKIELDLKETQAVLRDTIPTKSDPVEEDHPEDS